MDLDKKEVVNDNKKLLSERDEKLLEIKIAFEERRKELEILERGQIEEVESTYASKLQIAETISNEMIQLSQDLDESQKQYLSNDFFEEIASSYQSQDIKTLSKWLENAVATKEHINKSYKRLRRNIDNNSYNSYNKPITQNLEIFNKPEEPIYKPSEGLRRNISENLFRGENNQRQSESFYRRNDKPREFLKNPVNAYDTPLRKNKDNSMLNTLSYEKSISDYFFKEREIIRDIASSKKEASYSTKAKNMRKSPISGQQSNIITYLYEK